MKPYQHQIDIHKEALPVLNKYGMVYLSMEERTGKTLIALMLAESTKAKEILIITKKKALIGWEEHLTKYKTTKSYSLINYHSAHKIKIKPDLVIYDEAHYVLSGFPKPGKILKEIRKIGFNAGAIFLSATPSAQSFSQLFHTFAVTKYSPWNKYSNFYKWALDFVEKYQVQISGRMITKYDKTVPLLFEKVEYLFISYTRRELGFEHEPEDQLHFIPLSDETKQAFNILKKDGIYEDLVADSPMSLMVKLHQIEGGMIKDSELSLPKDKFNYFLEHFGDREDTVVMSHYIKEQKWLAKNLKYATVLSSTAYAEGISLAHKKTLVIYSMGFSTSQHTQRRARQCNMNRKDPITVHFLLVKKGISEAIYKTVAINGKNFVSRYYR